MLKIMLQIFGVMIILLITVVVIANIRFNQKVDAEVKQLFNDVNNNKKIVQKADLADLPRSIQKWLEYSQVIGKEEINTVRLKQKASMRTEPGKSWMPTEAEQYFTTNKPGFIWKAKIKAAPFFYLVGRDEYYQGKGNMLIKILSLIKVADSSSKEIDQGTLLRYLAETVWFPTAALNSYITWEEIGTNKAKATMSYKGVTASGVFTFNDKGEVVNFTAERYKETNGEYSLETWSIPVMEYKEFSGYKVPAKAEVIWKLDSGDFKWFKLEITDIKYNKPVLY